MSSIKKLQELANERRASAQEAFNFSSSLRRTMELHFKAEKDEELTETRRSSQVMAHERYIDDDFEHQPGCKAGLNYEIRAPKRKHECTCKSTVTGNAVMQGAEALK